MGKSASKAKQALEEDRADELADELRGAHDGDNAVIQLTDNQTPRKTLNLGALALNIKEEDGSAKPESGLKSVWDLDLGDEEETNENIMPKECMRSDNEETVAFTTEDELLPSQGVYSRSSMNAGNIEQRQRHPKETHRADNETGILVSEHGALENNESFSSSQAVAIGGLREAKMMENIDRKYQKEKLADDGDDLKPKDTDAQLVSEMNASGEDAHAKSPNMKSDDSRDVHNSDHKPISEDARNEGSESTPASTARESSSFIPELKIKDGFTDEEPGFHENEQIIGEDSEKDTSKKLETEFSLSKDPEDKIQSSDQCSVTLSDISELDQEEEGPDDVPILSVTSLNTEDFEDSLDEPVGQHEEDDIAGKSSDTIDRGIKTPRKEPIMASHFKDFLALFRIGKKTKPPKNSDSLENSDEEEAIHDSLEESEDESNDSIVRCAENAVAAAIGMNLQDGELKDQLITGDMQAIVSLSAKVKEIQRSQDNNESELKSIDFEDIAGYEENSYYRSSSIGLKSEKEHADRDEKYQREGTSGELIVIPDSPIAIAQKEKEQNGNEGFANDVGTEDQNQQKEEKYANKDEKYQEEGTTGELKVIPDSPIAIAQKEKKQNGNEGFANDVGTEDQNQQKEEEYANKDEKYKKEGTTGELKVIPDSPIAIAQKEKKQNGNEGFANDVGTEDQNQQKEEEYANKDEKYKKEGTTGELKVIPDSPIAIAQEKEQDRNVAAAEDKDQQKQITDVAILENEDKEIQQDPNYKRDKDDSKGNTVAETDLGNLEANRKESVGESRSEDLLGDRMDLGFARCNGKSLKKMPSVDRAEENMMGTVTPTFKLGKCGKMVSVQEDDNANGQLILKGNIMGNQNSSKTEERGNHIDGGIESHEESTTSDDKGIHSKSRLSQASVSSVDDSGISSEAASLRNSDAKLDASSQEGTYLSEANSVDSNLKIQSVEGQLNKENQEHHTRSGRFSEDVALSTTLLLPDASGMYEDSLESQSLSEDGRFSREISLDSDATLGDVESSESTGLSRDISIDSEFGVHARSFEQEDRKLELPGVELSDELGIIYDDVSEWAEAEAASLEMRQDDRGIMMSDDDGDNEDSDDDVFRSDPDTRDQDREDPGKVPAGSRSTSTSKGSKSRDGRAPRTTKVKFRSKNVTVGWRAMKLLSAECVPDGDGLEGKLHESAVKMTKLLQDAEQSRRADSPDVEGAQAKVTLQAYGLKIGDKVMVGGVKTGVLRFCGPTEFASGIWAGIELDEAAGKNDGSVGGVSYFKCSPKHGIFAPVTKISRPGILVNRGGSTPRKAVNYGHVDTSKVTAKVDTVSEEEESEKGLHRTRSGRSSGGVPGEESLLEPGERVLVAGQRRGVIRFSGETDFAPGWWYGIELDRPVGKNDGSVNNKRYFTCKPKYGVFAPPSRIQKLSDLPDAGECLEAVAERQRRLSGGAGTASQPALSSSSSKARPGPTRQQGFLETSNIPTTPKRPAPKSSGSSSGLRRPLALSNSGGEFRLQEGTSVFCNNELGVIRYMGTVEFAEGIWLGVELRTSKGKNDGAVSGTRYFTCRPNHGLLVRPSKVTVRGINGAKLMGNLEVSDSDKKDTSY